MKEIRNIAIIAHVDHGKTTLVDQILRQCDVFRKNQVVRERFLDSNDLERERGITILSKNISIPYKDTKINIIDTPGHADFGGEVERVLKMADSVLLLVDSFEGPMPQTRFVLSKALQLKLRPMVIINKIDRPDNRPDEVLDEVYDLFIELEAKDEQLDFPVIYASGRDGWAIKELEDERKDLTPLLDAILEHLPEPKVNEGPLQIQVTTLDYNDYVGRIGIGRVFRGNININERFSVVKRDGSIKETKLKQLFVFDGLVRTEVEEVQCGDICAMVGVDDIDIGDTITHLEHPEPLPIIAIDEPTISMTFTVNNSPLYGKEGKFVTSRHLYDRLQKELQSNVALRVEDTGSPDTHKVSGRGVLHLSILLENMRREGYELQVGEPRVIYKEIDGKKAEPIEELTVDVPPAFAGKVIEIVSERKGMMVTMEMKGAMQKLEFHIPSRGIMGLRNRLLTATQGEAIVHHRFYQYEFFKGSITGKNNGVLISMTDGPSTAYAIDSLQDRGKFFIDPGVYCYKGQIVGEHNKDIDIEVNVQRGKKLSNMRSSGADKAVRIVPALKFTLEEALEYINEDEYVEVTPESIRLRKIHLDPNDRKKLSMGKKV
ncbi:MAG: translational GTPase TypA [Bacteroidetes bacterium]|nr:translational GTPase TypA [Bacteroidota bacterium]